MKEKPYPTKTALHFFGWLCACTVSLAQMSCSSTPTLESVLAEVCPPIPSLVAALKSKTQITIVAIGSSSIKGVGASAPDKTFPAQLEKMLRSYFPDKSVVVLNKGVNGDRIDQMSQRFESDVLSYNPDLVIWQTGINDALQNKVPIFISELPAALSFLKRKATNLIIMDLQYTGEAQDSSQILVEQTLLNETSNQSVGVLPRYKLMQEVVKQDIYPLSRILYTDNLHLNDLGYEILSKCAMNRIL